ncbi:16S rRNA (cytidine(1402)-2'-O)-methyltransferase [Caldicoprobacter algeriensis]|uniref:16S rRNA (cytidine(1402)-2'-O)-methyltransferase n=1 Tax=Caldicoprobacter algeriensis TaxID=699281 RepID=UPI002079A44C|nr:16S rRNA (cytidine(1402)-2'-O)-methyltransferase [Caldicoprobacter algeriensis]MCM8901851.1 16S rRNA (cytidine(1402)-2'-O)-methyltransferase [Caldicoprobacter algeriensis]
MSATGTLYICATPIGNLEDITLRALRILSEVDYIVAEDTRHTLKLLNHYGISKPLISYHEHNQRERGQRIIELLMQGYNVALVSDSGMPGISDPGIPLIGLARQNGIPVTVLPGPTASIAALVLSGMDTSRFVFEGFLPREKKDREARLEELKREQRTVILYEAPHRLVTTLKDMLDKLGNRKVAVVRELTKVHEEVIILNLEQMLEHFKEHPPKGEIVLILEGCTHQDIQDNNTWNISIEEHIRQYMAQGFDKKEAVKQVAKVRGLPKSEVYKHSIDI